MLRFLQKKSGKRLGNKYILIMQKIGNIVKHINKQGKQNMANTVGVKVRFTAFWNFLFSSAQTVVYAFFQIAVYC